MLFKHLHTKACTRTSLKAVSAQRGYDFVQRYSVTSKCTIVNAVMSAKSSDDALNLAIVENPFVCTSAPSIEVVSYQVRQRSADRIEIHAIVAVDVDGHPVCQSNAPDRGCTRVVRAGVAVVCHCCRRR